MFQKKFKKYLSVRTKIIILTSSTSIISISIVFMIFLFSDYITIQDILFDELKILARVIAKNSVGSVYFNNSKDASEVIDALKVNKSIQYACIYTKEKTILAEYKSDDDVVNDHQFPAFPSFNAPLIVKHENHVDIFQSIVLMKYIPFNNDEEYIGLLYIRSDMNRIYNRIHTKIVNTGYIFTIAVLFSFLFSTIFQRFISKPLSRIVETTKTISKNKDYSIRAEKYTNDEFGILIDHLNQMLMEIESRDNALIAYYEDLENQVLNRTNELTKLNHQLTISKEKAEAANHAKSEFLTTMSHEIRTPMNAVLGMVEMLKESMLSNQQKQYVKIIHDSGNTLLSLINDILDLSKFESNQVVLEKISFNLINLMEQTCRVFANNAQKKGIELICNLDPEVPENLIGDPSRLRQIIFNLIGNAIKFTHIGEVELLVTLSRPIRNSDKYVHLLFCVKDTGIGIRKSELNQIFEPFSQGLSSTSRQYGGTGLGLAICKRLSHMMKGQIFIQSQENKGTTFLLELSLLKDKSIQHAFETFHSIRIFLGEDNLTNSYALKRLLTSWGIRVHESNSGHECIQNLQKNLNYHLILIDESILDAKMWHTIKEIFEKSDSAPPIILMVNTTSRLLYASHKDSQHDFIIKPILRKELYDIIKSVCDSKKTSFQWDIMLQPIQTDINKNHTVEFESESDTEDRSFEKQAPINSSGNAKTILLAEDNLNNQIVFTMFLSETDHHIDIANNGIEAVEKFMAKQYDFVFMDIEMPILDGYQATQKIREWEESNGIPKTPIVALTAHALNDHQLKTIKSGCDKYMSKPVNKNELLNYINKQPIKPKG